MRKAPPSPNAGGLLSTMCGTALCVAAASAAAQDAPRPAAASSVSDPNPYYVGVSQGFTHDSNVFRVPSGPSDTFSSTSLFGGFDQPISRQRVFGRGSVSLNRYQDEKQLNNTSYDLSAGADLETIENISGGVSVGMSRNLAAPTSIQGAPEQVSNVGTTKRADARLRWGGPSLLTVEGSLGYARVDYSAPEYVTSETRQTTGSLGLFYRPGALLRLGVAARFDRSRTPQAVVDPVTGSYVSNSADGSNIDFLADYAYSGVLSGNLRLSYTHQSNSQVEGADFSGFTGSLGLAYRLTGKTSLQLDVSRVAGFDAGNVTTYSAVQTATGFTLTPVIATYQNSQITNTVGLGASYAATAKIGANARLRYSRAKMVSGAAAQTGGDSDTVDVYKGVSLGLSYDITRGWGASCNASYEKRNVTGPVAYSYHANTIGCATQYVWR